MGSTETIILIAVLAVVFTPIYWLARYCVRVGAKRAVRDIVLSFPQVVPENQGDLVLDDENELKELLGRYSGWYPLWRASEPKDFTAQMQIEHVGRMHPTLHRWSA
jgi:hypothetical protein